jgi:hypothetical protein
MPADPLSDVVKSELAVYIRHLAGRVETMVRAIPEDQLWTKPFPFGNSVGNLVLHLTGNLSHYVGAKIGGSGYVRDRAREFSDPGGYPGSLILQRFHEAVDRVVGVIQARSAEDLGSSVSDEAPARTQFGLLLMVAAHLNNHVGQMSYLVRALGYDPNQTPMW